MNYEQLIERMAQAIRVTPLEVYGGHELCQEYESIEGGRALAKAALKALQDEMNDTLVEEVCEELGLSWSKIKSVDNVASDALIVEKWNELKTLGDNDG